MTEGQQNEEKKINDELPESGSRLREIRAVLHKHHIAKGVNPEKLRAILEDLGPTYVKLGQIMSLHSDILPKAYCDELMKLNTEVTPMSFETVESVLNDSYDGNWHEVFSEIDHHPLGSASIAQVHRAKLTTGEDVIVKVERKGIYSIMSRDIRLLHKAVKFLPSVGNIKNIVDLDMILDEMWSVAQQEMDFSREAENMKEFAANNKNIRYIAVPKLYDRYTTQHTLVMEYIDGPGIDDKERLIELGYDLEEIGSKYVNNFIKQVMDDGFFHADPHPGNVKIRDGKIVWLDMGMMGRLTERDRRIMVKAVQGIALHDTAIVTDAVLELGDFWGKPDREKLHGDIRDFLQHYGSQGMGSVDLAVAMQELMDIMKTNRISMPHGVSMLARGLTHVEGVLASISPNINMIEIAANRVAENFFKNVSWKSELGKYSRKIYRGFEKGLDIPSLMSELLNETLRGQTRLKLDMDVTDKTSNLVDAAVRHLVIGICITALLISASIICTTNMKPQILGIPLVGFIGYLVAIVSVAYFVMRFFYRKFSKWLRSRPPRRRRHRD